MADDPPNRQEGFRVVTPEMRAALARGEQPTFPDGAPVPKLGWVGPVLAPDTFDKGEMSADEFLRSFPGAYEYLVAEYERQLQRPPTIELSPDYGVTIPLWPQEDRTETLIPTDLLERLIAWQQLFNVNFEPGSGWTSMAVKTKWTEEAVQLEADLRAAVDGRFAVEVDLWPLNPGFVHTSQLNRPPMI